MDTLSQFFLGSSYYPPFHDPEDWERDIARMQELGFNAMRTAELIATWEWVEPRKGEFDFGWFDRVFELSEKYQLQILLGTGVGNPPIWLLDLYPEVQILSHDMMGAFMHEEGQLSVAPARGKILII